MIDHETQTATTYPTRAETIMALTIIAVLIIQVAATIRVATYQPECVPAVVATEEE
jgi:hypothetical protein